MLDINELLDDIRKVRNDLVAQANPHFQSLTNIIYKWETKLVEEKEYLADEKALADYADSFKEKDDE
jgi:sensor domain CHASE-containing protein